MDQKTEEVHNLVEGTIKYEQDSFCNALMDILSRDRILPKKVRTLKSILKTLSAESALGQEALFFVKDKNLKELHNALSNLRACKIFLMIDEGLNITQIADEILNDEQARNRPKEFRTYVQYWTNKFKDVQLIKKSEYSKGRETLYEKNDEEYPNLIRFINYLCLNKVKEEAKKVAKSTVGKRLLERREI